MPLLVITLDESEVSADLSLVLRDLATVHVDSLERAAGILAQDSLRAVLVIGHAPGAAPGEVLDFLHSRGFGLPVFFWDTALTARDATRLVRNGAASCFDGAPTDAGSLEECLLLIDRPPSEPEGLGRQINLIGESRPMRVIASMIRLVAPRRSTVLITGESGTGKEVAARAIHKLSGRPASKFVAINCSAIPEHLLESELFGHVKGAFTGAVDRRIGRFEQANGGSIFLDEIGDLPLHLQAKLLRVLQEREIQRVGGSDTLPIDVRIIAATNASLSDAVSAGTFRADLFHRLNVVPIHMPPLRDRIDDIPHIADHLIRKICLTEGLTPKGITPEAIMKLRVMPWPGNVRQLEHVLEAAIVLSGDRPTLSLADFSRLLSNPFSSGAPAGPAASDFEAALDSARAIGFEATVERFRQSLLAKAIEKAGGNKSLAAEILSMKRTTFMMKLRARPHWEPPPQASPQPPRTAII